ncbi:MAG: hypothetical protein RIR43_1536, partial [Pseudomonadota bacterium]
PERVPKGVPETKPDEIALKFGKLEPILLRRESGKSLGCG